MRRTPSALRAIPPRAKLDRHKPSPYRMSRAPQHVVPMRPFELVEPTSLSEAIKLLDPDDETIRPIAGGTALMLMMKAGVYRPAKLVSLRKIERKYSSIAAAPGGLTIGAMTTLSDLERSADLQNHAPLVTRTLPTLSNVRVRNVATVG